MTKLKFLRTIGVLIVSLPGITFSLQASAQQDPAPTGQQLFEPVASVLQGPRCLNCHMVEAPHQKDTFIPHAQKIVRGQTGHGAETLQCAACHQTKNSADGKVPGAPNWHLAPVSMAWEGLTKVKLCQAVKDPAKNGDRKTMDEVIEHMKTDPLVLWAWNPGSRPLHPRDVA